MKKRAQREILWWVTQFCTTRVHNGNKYPSIYGFVSTDFGGPKAQPGDLIRLESAPCSPWYLSWLHEVEVNTYGNRYLCESVETQELCWWENVGVSFLERDILEDFPQWKWTDRQYQFRDRWFKVCYKRGGAYIVLPIQPIFNGDYKVTLGTRTRFSLDTIAPRKEFSDWRKITKAAMLDFYKECESKRSETTS